MESPRGSFAVFLVRRLISGVLLLVAVATATFVLISLAPGDTAQVFAGQAGADPEYLELIRERLQLDRPLPYQVGSYLESVAQGDLGFSLIQGRPVRDAIFSRLPASLLLAGAALVLSAFLGITFGVIAAARRGGALDASISVFSLVAYSLPVFWLGQLLVALFAVRLRWLPAGGMRSADDPGGIVDLVRHLVLPATTFSLLLAALLVRVTRTATAEALGEDYVTTARAKGASERRVLLSHALPNALRPVVTVLTGYLGIILTGAVLVETVFVWPGLGRLLYDSVLSRDTPMLAGLLLFSATLVLLANLLADVIYRVLDPKTRFR
ncbi:MAG: ABC transporter permease [Actinobacteria bacterium]|nr:ABC transporter permease [Actinomycetota bacterium]